MFFRAAATSIPPACLAPSHLSQLVRCHTHRLLIRARLASKSAEIAASFSPSALQTAAQISSATHTSPANAAQLSDRAHGFRSILEYRTQTPTASVFSTSLEVAAAAAAVAPEPVTVTERVQMLSSNSTRKSGTPLTSAKRNKLSSEPALYPASLRLRLLCLASSRNPTRRLRSARMVLHLHSRCTDATPWLHRRRRFLGRI